MVRRTLVIALLLAAPRLVAAARPMFPEVAAPESFGRVVLDRASTKARVPAVVFDHWRHRAMYSCRLCHVDVGFAMEAGASEISRATNQSGLHCGACHDGKKLHDGKPIFAGCADAARFADSPACARCHRSGSLSSLRAEYLAFAEKMPLYAGGYVDWEAAEARGLVKPADFVEGLSIARAAMKIDKDVPIEVKGTWLGGVTFSHKKHAVWNGCEVCHPEIFPSTKAGTARYDMAAIREGRYCGACHKQVAFPLAYCQRCHKRGGFEME